MMLLDFEKPIAELESKLQDMKQLASGSDKEVQRAVKAWLATRPVIQAPRPALYAGLHL
jgi:hypothetical protein